MKLHQLNKRSYVTLGVTFFYNTNKSNTKYNTKESKSPVNRRNIKRCHGTRVI